MTARQILRVALRRWYAVVLVGALTLAALWVAVRQPPVFYTRYELVLLAPHNASNLNTIEDPQYSLAPLAGVIVHDVMGDGGPEGLASTDTTLYGEGIREGVRARLPNLGNQFQPVYGLPNIVVEAVASDPERAAREADQLSKSLEDRLEVRQDELRISDEMRVRMIASPADPVVVGVRGSRTRAAGALSLLGLSLAVTLVYWLELAARRRSRRKEA